MRKWLTVNEFKKACMAGVADAADERVRKGVIAEVKKSTRKSDLGGTVLDFKISDGSVDRDNDTIDPKGWTLDNYKSNPVVLWAHDYDTPAVGRSLVSSTDEALFAEAEFTPKDLNPFGHMVGQLYEHGFQRAASVGFIPSDWTESEERAGDSFFPGLDFSKQDLLEWSTVPVPSNPTALQGAKSLGIDLGPMSEWAERILDGEHGPGLWLPAKDAERIYMACKTGGVVIDLKAAGSPPSGPSAPPDDPPVEPAPEPVIEPSDDPAVGDEPTVPDAATEAAVKALAALGIAKGSPAHAMQALRVAGWDEADIKGLFSSSSHFDHAHALQLTELNARVDELEAKGDHADPTEPEDDDKAPVLELVETREPDEPVLDLLDGDDDEPVIEFEDDVDVRDIVTAATRDAMKHFKRTVLGRLD